MPNIKDALANIDWDSVYPIDIDFGVRAHPEEFSHITVRSSGSSKVTPYCKNTEIVADIDIKSDAVEICNICIKY